MPRSYKGEGEHGKVPAKRKRANCVRRNCPRNLIPDWMFIARAIFVSRRDPQTTRRIYLLLSQRKRGMLPVGNQNGGSSRPKRRICHEISEAVPQPSVQLDDKAGA